jgi:hypothetical protein
MGTFRLENALIPFTYFDCAVKSADFFMEKYLTELEASPIPLPKWGVIILWGVIFILEHFK